MNIARVNSKMGHIGSVASVVLAILACTPKEKAVPTEDRASFATRYAAAWSGKDPVAFGAFYSEKGSLVVNGSATVGRGMDPTPVRVALPTRTFTNT